MGTVSIVMGDPGSTADPFGVVGIQYDSARNKMSVKIAKQFHKKPYAAVAKFFQKIKNSIDPEFLGMETNNRGRDALKLFRTKYNMLYVHGITTSANLKEETRQNPHIMDKKFMIQWFRQNQNIMEFPEKPTKDMQELIRQITEIVRVNTGTGYTYRRMRGRHDDLFMALLLCCNVVRLYQHYKERMSC